MNGPEECRDLRRRVIVRAGSASDPDARPSYAAGVPNDKSCKISDGLTCSGFNSSNIEMEARGVGDGMGFIEPRC